MTTYGTIPTSIPIKSTASISGEPSEIGFFCRCKSHGREALASRRPWGDLFHANAFSLPRSFGEAYLQIRYNASYFALNYVIVVVFVVCLSLLWHPIFLFIFIYLIGARIYLFLLGRTTNNGIVLIGVAGSLGLLFIAGVAENILISLFVGLVVVVLHAGIRRTDDLLIDEEAAGSRGLRPAGGDSGGRSPPSLPSTLDMNRF